MALEVALRGFLPTGVLRCDFWECPRTTFENCGPAEVVWQRQRRGGVPQVQLLDTHCSSFRNVGPQVQLLAGACIQELASDAVLNLTPHCCLPQNSYPQVTRWRDLVKPILTNVQYQLVVFNMISCVSFLGLLVCRWASCRFRLQAKTSVTI